MPANLLDRQFATERPNQKWIADFTYIWTAEGWLYVSAVIDLFLRRVVGWSMSASMTAQLVHVVHVRLRCSIDLELVGKAGPEPACASVITRGIGRQADADFAQVAFRGRTKTDT